MADREDALDTIVARSPVGLCLADADGLVLEANARWCALAGTSAAACVGAPWTDAIHPVERAELARRFADPAKAVSATCRVGPGPRAPWVRLERLPAAQHDGRVVVSATDISELKDSETALSDAFSRALEAETLLQEAIDAMSEGFIYCDADDRIVCFNAKHRELFPSHAEVMRPGLLFEDLLRAQIKGIRLEAAVGREEDWIAERLVQHRNPAGSIEQRWADGRVIRLSEYKTRSGGIVSIRADITDLKKAEAEVLALNEELEERVIDRTRALEQAQDELVRGERLAALGQLIASVSHELRSPLGTIATSLGTLRDEDGRASPRRARAMARIERAALRCNAIVGELLDFSRPAALAIEDTPIDDWLEAVLDELPNAPGVDVVRRLAAPGVRAQIDRERLRRVMVNLFDNACQALDGTGTVAIETEPRNGYVAISVSDDGPGIGDDELRFIFDPMYTTKSSGVGLGLAIVKRIVEQHGAAIEVERAVPRGARFTIVAPKSG